MVLEKIQMSEKKFELMQLPDLTYKRQDQMAEWKLFNFTNFFIEIWSWRSNWQHTTTGLVYGVVQNL